MYQPAHRAEAAPGRAFSLAELLLSAVRPLPTARAVPDRGPCVGMSSCEQRITRPTGCYRTSRADDGNRTRDLLLGKQTPCL